MTSLRKILAGAALAIFSLLSFSATGQRGQAPVVADTNATADDLLTQPPGTNWTSYNGDYTGRRYSALH